MMLLLENITYFISFLAHIKLKGHYLLQYKLFLRLLEVLCGSVTVSTMTTEGLPTSVEVTR